MTAVTPLLALPYPEVTDRVADGWDAIRDLATALDTLVAARATIAQLNAVNAALDARLDALEALNTDSGWIAATLATGWANYGGGYATAAYRKIRGTVHLRGLVTASGFPEHAVHVFNLPAGYRPHAATHSIFAGVSQLNTPDVADVGVRVDITSGGNVQPTLEATNTSGAVGWVSLSGITFPADA